MGLEEKLVIRGWVEGMSGGKGSVGVGSALGLRSHSSHLRLFDFEHEASLLGGLGVRRLRTAT